MKWTTRKLKEKKLNNPCSQFLSMLTCYDYQTAQLLEEVGIDLILVGDSLGNVILGYDHTISVSLDDMMTFGKAVKRGALDTFTIVDMPFGTYATNELAITNGIKLFQTTKVEALKLEGATKETLKSIKLLTEAGIPIMGHLGLTPQSVHQQGGYFIHGKKDQEFNLIYDQALALQEAGVFSLVLECVTPKLATKITHDLEIPTIGIGSGRCTNGQVLVINDLLKMGKEIPPSFCQPVSNLYETKKQLLKKYQHSLIEKSDQKAAQKNEHLHH